MKAFFYFLTICLSFGISADASPPTGFYSTTSKFDNKVVQSTLSRSDLDGVIKWLPAAGFPLGMNAAVVNAKKAFAESFKDYDSFTVESIDLVHLKGLNDWIFTVTFDGTVPSSTSPQKRVGAQIVLLELLNGKVIKPVVTTVTVELPKPVGGLDVDGDHPYPDLHVPDLHSTNSFGN